MGKEKGGFLTPKAIANRIKSKGLQKLRWYCQMCQKQCRDENGFKCHLTSESHQRQLLLFAENPDKYIDSFSEEFMETFIELLSRRFGTKRVQANTVYQEYINYRDHTHMNSTQWETLSDFVKWLGRDGHCVVDQTEKGWYIQYIDRDPETIKRQEAVQKKEKMALDDEEQTARFIQQQIERTAAASKEKPKSEFTELQRDESSEEKVTFNLGSATFKKPELPVKTQIAGTINPLASLGKKAEKSGEGAEASTGTTASSATSQPVKRKSALEEIMQIEEQKRAKVGRRDYWLHKGIVVKVVTKKLGSEYHKKKAVVREVVDRFSAVVKLLDMGVKLKVDQAHLETVMPALGKTVLVVNGAYRGEEAELVKLNEKSFSCAIKLLTGASKGRQVEGVEYEDISKLHVPS